MASIYDPLADQLTADEIAAVHTAVAHHTHSREPRTETAEIAGIRKIIELVRAQEGVRFDEFTTRCRDHYAGMRETDRKHLAAAQERARIDAAGAVEAIHRVRVLLQSRRGRTTIRVADLHDALEGDTPTEESR